MGFRKDSMKGFKESIYHNGWHMTHVQEVQTLVVGVVIVVEP